jgi:hypothetical protein
VGTVLAGVTVEADGTDAYLVSFAGELAGQNVAALEVAAVAVDAQLPQGSFQVSYDDEDGTRIYSPATAYSADELVLKANLQTAMDTLFGAGNVTVAVDEASQARRAALARWPRWTWPTSARTSAARRKRTAT